MSRNVRLPWPVAAFAAGVFRRFFARRDTLEVRILEKFRSDVGMARFARLASDKSSRRIFGYRRRLLLLSQRGQDGCQERE